jgi:outer membrane lipoprotein SlyB
MASPRALILGVAIVSAGTIVASAARAQSAAPTPGPTAAELLALPAPSGTPSPATVQLRAESCPQCGRVESVRRTIVRDTWTPLGTGVGVGGAPVTGTAAATTAFSIGRGGANQGLVMLGAAGGASYQKTPGAYDRPRWDVTVKLDTGQTRVVSLAFEPYVREGDRVRISGNQVELLD